jgi:hypothetical protein
LDMSEYEKHINILYYNLMKYKFYRNFFKKMNVEKTKNMWIKIVNSDIKTVENIKLIHNKIDWNKFLLKVNKLNKYIKNWNIQNNKIDLILNLFNNKILSWYDFYERLLALAKILRSLINLEEIINIYIYILKIFF